MTNGHISISAPHTPVGDPHIRYRLVRYRDYRGLSQQQVADRAGITREYVSMIENGRRRANSHHLLKALANALDVDITALITHRPDPSHEPPEHATTLRLHLRHLTTTVEPNPTGDGNVIVLTDGVLKIELAPTDSVEQDRNGVLRIAHAIGLYLSGASSHYEDDPTDQASQHPTPSPAQTPAPAPRPKTRPRRRRWLRANTL